MRRKIKKAATLSAKIIFAFGLIFWLIQSGRLEFTSLNKLLSPSFLIIGTVLLLCNFVFTSKRWHYLLQSQQIQIPYKQVWDLTLIGTFFNFAMPGGVGGDLIKGYYITRQSHKYKIGAAITVLIDRLVGLFALILMASLSVLSQLDLMLSNQTTKHITTALFTITILFTLGVFCLLHTNIFASKAVHGTLERLPKGKHLLQTIECLSAYKNNKKVFWISLLLSFFAQLCTLAFFIYAGHLLQVSEISYASYLFAVPIAFIVQAIPISPAGVGVGQAASFFLFSLITPNAGSIGPSTMTAFQIGQFGMGILGAFLYIKYKHHNNSNTES